MSYKLYAMGRIDGKNVNGLVDPYQTDLNAFQITNAIEEKFNKKEQELSR